MNALRSYFLSVIAVAIIGAITKQLSGERGTIPGISRMISGLLLMITIIAPLTGIKISDMEGIFDAYHDDAQQAVQVGIQISASSLASRIKSDAEAYILDKAMQYNANLTVEISLTNDDIPTPESVVISGNISPYAKNALQNIIYIDLGILEENQKWI